MKQTDLKVISGGTSGADLAGLWAALVFGVPTGGSFPKGSEPQLAEFFDMRESDSVYHGKTLTNCEQSDLTLIFASNIKSEGTKLTIHHCITNKIHYRVYCLGKDVQKSIDANYARLLEDVSGYKIPITINVAGNSTATSPQAFTYTFMMLCRLFGDLLGTTPPIIEKCGAKRVEEMLRDCYDQTVFEGLTNIERSSN